MNQPESKKTSEKALPDGMLQAIEMARKDGEDKHQHDDVEDRKDLAAMQLPVYAYPETFLRKKAAPIADITEDVKALAQQMAITLLKMGGAGLAAPQVGYSCRLIVVNLTGNPKENACFINPEIVSSSEEKVEMPEACLSIPKIRAKVIRPRSVTLKALNLDGEQIVEEIDGWSARVVQHEIDHLDGILFIDRVSGLRKGLLEGKLKRLRRNAKRTAKVRAKAMIELDKAQKKAMAETMAMEEGGDKTPEAQIADAVMASEK